MRHYPNSIWNDETRTLLRQWWEDKGLTYSRISTEFAALGYSVTRNAVVGKVHRMKLAAPEWKAAKLRQRSAEIMAITNKIKVIKPPAQRQIIIRGKKYNPLRFKEAAMTISKPDGKNAVLLKNSKDGQCKSITGYVGGRCEDAVYCGDPTQIVRINGKLIHSPWCPFHKKLYTQPPRPSKITPIYRRTSSHH